MISFSENLSTVVAGPVANTPSSKTAATSASLIIISDISVITVLPAKAIDAVAIGPVDCKTLLKNSLLGIRTLIKPNLRSSPKFQLSPDWDCNVTESKPGQKFSKSSFCNCDIGAAIPVSTSIFLMKT